MRQRAGYPGGVHRLLRLQLPDADPGTCGQAEETHQDHSPRGNPGAAMNHQARIKTEASAVGRGCCEASLPRSADISVRPMRAWVMGRNDVVEWTAKSTKHANTRNRRVRTIPVPKRQHREPLFGNSPWPTGPLPQWCFLVSFVRFVVQESRSRWGGQKCPRSVPWLEVSPHERPVHPIQEGCPPGGGNLDHRHTIQAAMGKYETVRDQRKAWFQDWEGARQLGRRHQVACRQSSRQTPRPIRAIAGGAGDQGALGQHRAAGARRSSWVFSRRSRPKSVVKSKA